MKIELQAPLSNPNFWSGYSAIPYVQKETNPIQGNDDTLLMPYTVKGPKKEWGLMRNQPNPSMLFPVPENFITGQPKIKGVEWFKEMINGEVVTLVPMI